MPSSVSLPPVPKLDSFWIDRLEEIELSDEDLLELTPAADSDAPRPYEIELVSDDMIIEWS
jgi:hypothetical protein